MNDLSPSSYVTMANKIATDDKFASVYQSRGSRTVDAARTCDANCRKGCYCGITSFDRSENAQCNGNSIFNWDSDF